MSRSSSTADLMWQRLFKRLDGIAPTRQGQLRDTLVQSIMDGFLQPGSPVPSSRMLAETLGLSRTTVTLALEALVDQGFLIAKPRSGFFVAEVTPTGVAPADVTHKGRETSESMPLGEARQNHWDARLQITPSSQQNIEKPRDWQQQPYPFVFGQFDATQFPFRNWRRCILETIEARSVRTWAPDHLDRDDPSLIEQIHSRLLPARGIWVEREQILVTSGAQQGLFLLAQLLVGTHTHVGLETPGYPDARNNFALRTPHLHDLDIDQDGLIPSEKVNGCDYVFVTPSHQCPTTVTMSMSRRATLLQLANQHDFVLIEDDHESELNFSSRPTPALKSLDTNERVIYLGSLSKTLAHGLRLGFIVAPATLIRELRALRRLMMRHIPSNNQQVAALFVAHGFHEAHVRNLVKTYRERSLTLRNALTRYAPELQFVPAKGGSALWVTGPAWLDTKRLAAELYHAGVVVEPGTFFFPKGSGPCPSMRVGYSSIPADQIESGIRVLATHIRRSAQYDQCETDT